MRQKYFIAGMLGLATTAVSCSLVGGANGNDPSTMQPTTGDAIFRHEATAGGTSPVAIDTLAAAGWKYESQLQRGVRHILDTQKSDGGWGSFVPERPADIYTGGVNSFHAFGNATSALCCMALLAQPSTPEIGASLERGYRYLVAAPEARRVTGDTFYSTWAHAYTIEALARGLRDGRFKDIEQDLRRRCNEELRLLWGVQGLDGGWGYYDFGMKTKQPSGGISTPFTTAAVMVGLHEAKEAGFKLDEHRMKIALDHLERMRVPNGAYRYSASHLWRPLGTASRPKGSLGRSQSGDCALRLWERTITPADLSAALDTFFQWHMFIEIGRHREYPHEAWYATAPYYYYFGHYYASINVNEAEPDKRAFYAGKLADIIAATQEEDGSFWDYPLFGYTKAYGTGYGVLILSNCRRQLAGKH